MGQPRMSSPTPIAAELDATETDTTGTLPVVRISPLLVFGLPPFWCIATCPMCDAAGFLQEDVQPLPPAACSKCAYGHFYRIELESEDLIGLDADFLDD
jgi:hypothetical protein